MKIPALATLLGVDSSTVLRWVQKGKLPATRPVDRAHWDVADEAAQQLISTGTYAADAPSIPA